MVLGGQGPLCSQGAVFSLKVFFCEKIVASGFWYVHLNQLLTFKSVTSNYHGNLHFKGLNYPYSEGLKPSCFMVLGSNGNWRIQPIPKICSSNWIKKPPRFGVKIEKSLSCHHLENHETSHFST